MEELKRSLANHGFNHLDQGHSNVPHQGKSWWMSFRPPKGMVRELNSVSDLPKEIKAALKQFRERHLTEFPERKVKVTIGFFNRLKILEVNVKEPSKSNPFWGDDWAD